MKKLLSFIASKTYLDDYQSREDLTGLIQDLGLDGIELIRCQDKEDKVDLDLVKGVHLPFYTSWMDYAFYRDEDLLEEYGDWETVQSFYQVERDKFYQYFLEDLDFAQAHGDYCVFHVNHVRSIDFLPQDYNHSSPEVIRGACQVINQILEGRGEEGPLFLMENLYSPGLTFTDPHLTDALLEGVAYKKKGFMLDTGHLMSTNSSLKNEDQAWAYIEERVRAHGSLKKYFRGIHLHASVTGPIREYYRQNPPKLPEDFMDRFREIYQYIGQIDTHGLALSDQARRVIDYIEPDYLVLEFKYQDRQDLVAKVKRQLGVLGY
ncbi:MAG: TIM barrel protein [Tissierellia bacterium]|nr:TIM barrel protein [Tissierellia bacterium]